MNEIRVEIEDLIKELQLLENDGQKYVLLSIEEAEPEEGIPARIMLNEHGCVFRCRN